MTNTTLTPQPDLEGFDDTLLDDYEAPPIDDVPALAAFVVDDDGKATWAARRLANHKAAVARMEDQAAAELARIDAWAEERKAPIVEWLDDSTRGEKSRVEWFTGLLVGFARRLHRDDPDCPKSRKFVGGSCGRKKKPDVLVIDDPALFVEWALTAGRHELLKIEPRSSAIKSEIGVSADVAEFIVPKVDRDKKGAPTTPGQTSEVVVVETGEAIPGVTYMVGEEDYWAKAE